MAPCDLNNFAFLCRGSLKDADKKSLTYDTMAVLVLKMIIYDDVNTKELFLDHSSKFEG